MEKNNGFSHDGIDAFVATVLAWCQGHFARTPEPAEDVAFSDEWERRQIARELHWN
jgi:hypothetical protein